MIKFSGAFPYDHCSHCNYCNFKLNACDVPGIATNEKGIDLGFNFSKCPGYQLAKVKSYIPDLTLSQEKEV